MGRSTAPGAPDYVDGLKDTTETPEHSASVADFELDKYEVTQNRYGEFVAFFGKNPSWRPAPASGAHPLRAGSGWNPEWDTTLSNDFKYESNNTCLGPTIKQGNFARACVSWVAAFAFCIWDGGSSPKRLPTEAEWEYAAATAGTNSLYPWSSLASPTAQGIAWGPSSALLKVPVGSTVLSPFGFADLAGGVAEWVRDAYRTYTGSCTGGDCLVLESATADARSVRGGSWSSDSELDFRAAARGSSRPAITSTTIGFRCARSQ
jgi:formylglycine-generating enzyme required for sulfatase activity